MEIKKTASNWKPAISEILDSKYNEFMILGYDKVTKDEIWNCLLTRVWKKDPELYLYEVVADIFQLAPNTYMNYLTHKTYKNDDLFASIQAVTGNKNAVDN